MRMYPPLAALLIVLATGAHAAAQGAPVTVHPAVIVRAAAVAETEGGLVGSIANFSITLAEPGTGHIFIDTYPLTQVDIQGSLRLAVRTAASVVGIDASRYDYFFVMRAGSQVVGGPSAGGTTAVGIVTAMMNAGGRNWTIDPNVLMTGTINPDGSIGPVGGVPEKAAAARDVGARVFLFPEGQERARLEIRGSSVLVNVVDYCADELRITCRAVGTIEDAVEAVTGERLSKPAPTGNVTTERFREILQPLAREVTENSSALLASASANATRETALASAVRGVVEERLATAREAQKAADDAYARGDYYTASSKSFQAALAARTAEITVDVYATPDPAAALGRALDAARPGIDAALRLTRGANATTFEELQGFGAAQSRARDAERSWQTARSSASVIDGVASLAYAIERGSTAKWWVRIGDRFAGSAALPPGFVATVARETLDAADGLVTYADVVLQQAGAGADPVPGARSALAAAHEEHEDGFIAAAVFDALDAEVRASLALELAGYGGAVPATKLARAETEAQAAILTAREEGYEPVLAVAYFEFAGSLPDADGLSYYNLAKMVAKLHRYTKATDAEPVESRFVGSAAASIPSAPYSAEVANAFLILGGVAGITIGLALGLVMAASRREKRS